MNDDNELSEQFDLALIETLGKPQILENYLYSNKRCQIILFNYQKIT